MCTWSSNGTADTEEFPDQSAERLNQLMADEFNTLLMRIWASLKACNIFWPLKLSRDFANTNKKDWLKRFSFVCIEPLFTWFGRGHCTVSNVIISELCRKYSTLDRNISVSQGLTSPSLTVSFKHMRRRSMQLAWRIPKYDCYVGLPLILLLLDANLLVVNPSV